MRLSDAEKKEFISQIKQLLEIEQVFEMNNYIQHGNTTTFTHCLMVAYYSYIYALRLPGKYDINSVIRGAMLHDFYLYDWHVPDKEHRLHGYFHPQTALNNAKKHFTLNSVEEDIIRKHMWPLTLRKVPSCREAMLVCLIDKFCSLTETLYIPVQPKDYRRLQRLLSRKGLVF